MTDEDLSEAVSADDPASPKQVQKASSDDPPHAYVIPVDVLADFLRRTAERASSTMTRTIRRAFYLDEDVLRAVDNAVRTALSGRFSGDVAVRCSVRFADLSTHPYDSLEECIANAASRRDPESLEISWTAWSELGAFHEVRLECVTEQALEPDRQFGPVPMAASIFVAASSQDRTWLEQTVASITDLVDANTKIPRQFRPLQIFRHEHLNMLFCHGLGALTYFGALSIAIRASEGESRAVRLQRILRAPTSSDRFDAFVRDYLRPEDSVLRSFILFALPFLLYWSVYLLASVNIVKFFPRSSLGIGLAKKRRQDRDNYISLIVVSVVLALVIALIANFIYGAIA